MHVHVNVFVRIADKKFDSHSENKTISDHNALKRDTELTAVNTANCVLR